MSISIVIPAFNEEHALPHCLLALSNQKTHYHFEVIIVDNASTDNTAGVARSWADKLNLTIIQETQKGRGAARRAGFAQAAGEIVLTTDADSIVPSDWVERLVTTLVNNSLAVAATSPSHITDGTRFTNWTMRYGMLYSLRLYRLLVGHYMAPGGSSAIRKIAYERAGGFDASVDMLDDIDLSFRLAQQGQIIFLPNLRVETEGDIFRGGFVKGFWHYFRHFPLLYIRYKLKNNNP